MSKPENLRINRNWRLSVLWCDGCCDRSFSAFNIVRITPTHMPLNPHAALDRGWVGQVRRLCSRHQGTTHRAAIIVAIRSPFPTKRNQILSFIKPGHSIEYNSALPIIAVKAPWLRKSPAIGVGYRQPNPISILPRFPIIESGGAGIIHSTPNLIIRQIIQTAVVNSLEYYLHVLEDVAIRCLVRNLPSNHPRSELAIYLALRRGQGCE